jgi:hypothetical protein
MSYINIPFLNPFKFIKWLPVKGIHFDDRWTKDQVHRFEMPVYYKQKWRRQVKTKLQVESSIAPQPIEYINHQGETVKSTPWVNVFASIAYSIYEVEVDFTDLPNRNTYFLYVGALDGADLYPALTEPIYVADEITVPNLLFEYNHHFNKDGVAWTTGIVMRFICEAGIVEFTPKGERTVSISQTQDVKTLDGVASRQFGLYIGTATGVPPYVMDLLNRIFKCSRVLIEDMQYQAAPETEIEKTFIKGNRMMGGKLDIVPAFNNDSLVLTNAGVLVGRPGIVTAYNIETAFFGPGSLVPILDIEIQG